MAPQAEPITTVDEIDEALWWVLMTAPRKLDYMRIVDALLDQRNRVAQGLPPLAPPAAPHERQHEGHPAGRRT